MNSLPTRKEPPAHYSAEWAYISKLASKSWDETKDDALEKFLVCDRYEVTRFIATGGFSNVFKVRDVTTGIPRAMKVYRKTTPMTNSIAISRDCFREVEFMVRINSKAAKYRQQFFVESSDDFIWCEKHFLVMELMSTSLRDVLADSTGLKLTHALSVGLQICGALDFLKSMKVVHLDIKPENILFKNSEKSLSTNGKVKMANKKIKLADFGSAKNEDALQLHVKTTMRYRAPEVAMQGPINSAADIWSAACTIFECYAGKFLFPCDTEQEKLYMMPIIIKEAPDPALAKKMINTTVFDESGKLFPCTMEFSSSDVKPLEEHNEQPGYSMLNELFDLLKRMLRSKWKHRITAQEACCHPVFNLLSTHYYKKK